MGFYYYFEQLWQQVLIKQHSYWAGLFSFLIKSSLALSAAGQWSRCLRQLGWAAGWGCWVPSPRTSSRAWKSCSRACPWQVFPLTFSLFCSHFSFSLPRTVCFWVSAEPSLCILYPLSSLWLSIWTVYWTVYLNDSSLRCANSRCGLKDQRDWGVCQKPHS